MYTTYKVDVRMIGRPVETTWTIKARTQKEFDSKLKKLHAKEKRENGDRWRVLSIRNPAQEEAHQNRNILRMMDT